MNPTLDNRVVINLSSELSIFAKPVEKKSVIGKIQGQTNSLCVGSLSLGKKIADHDWLG